ncbi:EcoRI family type II restriction endonuclease [Phascolarctobacterium faecium]|uniref:EcoRI family type II restriction endonuclease n=1 Tax=Phascolarctobacterium faecium TaxID=33025 RepID=UPI00242B4591|nr:EcoRI family type II restriction endonuclease [Phascolarctobacterium faecium]MDY3989983.1 EcoRI family type II restriction endonuclease [Massilioclostridium sp.]
MKKGQSNRLTVQQKEGQGPITIFHKDAQIHDKEVGNTSLFVKKQLEFEFPMLTFRYRKDLYKKEINEALKRVDEYLGQTLFVESASIRPDGGLIEVQDDNGNWRVVLVSEAKHQGKDIENIRTGKLVGKKNNQDLMAAGNAIERAYKNVNEIANFMLSERYFPYILFLEGSNFLTQNVTVIRPDGREVTLVYNDGTLNRLDRLTAANYGMPINTNLCENRFVKCNGATIMLQAASIYTKGGGGHWNDKDMIMIMLEVARTSLKMLGSDLFEQLSKR